MCLLKALSMSLVGKDKGDAPVADGRVGRPGDWGKA